MSIEPLELAKLNYGDLLKVAADDFNFFFWVVAPGFRPQCELIQTGGGQDIVGPSPVILEGTGTLTNRNQNPVQSQEQALTISDGVMRLGAFAVVIPDSRPDVQLIKRLVLEPAVTTMDVYSARPFVTNSIIADSLD